jgi:hypothetical protein
MANVLAAAASQHCYCIHCRLLLHTDTDSFSLLLQSSFFLLTYLQIRDSIMLVTGPDKGRTGRMIGQEIVASRGGATSKKAVIKLNNTLGGIREIKVVPYEMVAKTFQQG